MSRLFFARNISHFAKIFLSGNRALLAEISYPVFQMPSYYQYSSYSTPSGGVRRTSTTTTSYSSSNFGDPSSGIQRKYSSTSNDGNYRTTTTTTQRRTSSSSSHNKMTDDGLITSYAGSANDIFNALNNAENAKGYKDQDYNKLKEKCRRTGQLFEDSTFPANDRSLFFSQPSPRRFVWKRPGVSVYKHIISI